MPDCRLVYVTTASRDEALAIGRAVVERRLAACANVFDGATSIYWWDGAVQAGAECIMILKTIAPRVTALVETIRSLHSYDCPAISVIAIESGNPAYLAWIAAETSADPEPSDTR
ncbi:MAG: divalent-cation tolerance protein CutA [Alphaproteobacteria bacterium]